MGRAVEVEGERWARTGGTVWSYGTGHIWHPYEGHMLLFAFYLPVSSLGNWIALVPWLVLSVVLEQGP